jgi:hypothetical protein
MPRSLAKEILSDRRIASRSEYLLSSGRMKPGALLAPLRISSAWRRPSVVALLAANLVPLVCVLAFDWPVFPLMLLFWAENVVIGGFNILKLLACRTDGPTLGKFFLIPFFTLHYGMFTLVHGIFVVALFGGAANPPDSGPDPGFLLRALWEQQLGLPVLALAASHGVSFVTNFLRGGERAVATLPQLMFQPYGRIVMLHITILGGGFLMQMLNAPTLGLALLVAVKCVVDVVAHLREREKFAVRSGTATDACNYRNRGKSEHTPL